MKSKSYTVSVINLGLDLENKNSDNIETKIPIEIEGKVKKNSRKYIGIFLAFFSSLTFSLGSLIVKLLINNGYHVMNIGLWRFFGIFLIYIPILVYFYFVKKQNIFEGICPATLREKFKIWGLVFGRCISGVSAIVLQFLSLYYINLSDSLVISFSTPVFLALITPIVLKEKFSIISIVLAIITLLGVGIMIRPPIFTGGKDFDGQILAGTGIALSSMVSTGISFIFLQSLRKIHFTILLSALGLWGTFQCLILSFIFEGVRLPQGLYDWGLCIALIILSFGAQTSLTLALKYEKAGPVSLIRTSDAVFGHLWQFFILSVSIDLISISGQIVVVFGVVVAILREWINKLPDGNSTRETFKFLLK